MHPPVRLIAIDMDGTLLPTFAQAISPRNAQALRAAQQAGITVAIATAVSYTHLDVYKRQASKPVGDGEH